MGRSVASARRNGGGRAAFRLCSTQPNVHGPGVDLSENVALVPVRPGNSDLCFAWDGPTDEAIEYPHVHGVEVETGPVERAGAHDPGTQRLLPRSRRSLLELMSYE